MNQRKNMKKKIITLLAFALFYAVRSFAQECSTAYYFSAKKEIIFNKYDKAGKYMGKDVGTISGIKQENGALQSTYRLIKYDAEGKVKEDGNAKIICENMNVRIGFQVPDMESGQSKDAYFTYPAGMTSGQNLESKMELKIKGKTNGKKMDVEFKVENRKVIGREKVKTPAGDYDAVEIGYDMSIRFKVMGIGIPMKLKVLEWYSYGIGIVKTETYNKDGELQETSLLSSFK